MGNCFIREYGYDTSREEFPEVVGMKFEDAVKVIRQINPTITDITKATANEAFLSRHDPSWIIVFVNSKNVVIQCPSVYCRVLQNA